MTRMRRLKERYWKMTIGDVDIVWPDDEIEVETHYHDRIDDGHIIHRPDSLRDFVRDHDRTTVKRMTRAEAEEMYPDASFCTSDCFTNPIRP